MLYISVTQLSSLANIYNKTNVLKHIFIYKRNYVLKILFHLKYKSCIQEKD